MQDWSEENGRKLDRIIQLLEGDGEGAPGLIKRVAAVERVLQGVEGTYGVITKVTIMWRFWIWILCTASAGVGALATELFKTLHHII